MALPEVTEHIGNSLLGLPAWLCSAPPDWGLELSVFRVQKTEREWDQGSPFKYRK